MIIRILQILLLVAVAWVAYRLVKNALAPRPPEAPPRGEFEPMARCERCGTHVPRTQLDPAGLCPKCR